MGGERETTVEQKSPESQPKEESPQKVGKLRIHESGGKVHFHDDDRKLKVEVPVSEWWKAWDYLKHAHRHWSYVDMANNSYLEIATDMSNGSGVKINTILDIQPIIYVSETYKELNKFTRKA